MRFQCAHLTGERRLYYLQKPWYIHINSVANNALIKPFLPEDLGRREARAARLTKE